MSKELSLLDKLYFREEYWQVTRIIGYAGCTPSDFWDAAKKLPRFAQHKFESALYELTRWDKREASPPRYELRDDVRRFCWQLLGPPPEDEDRFYRHPDGTPRERS